MTVLELTGESQCERRFESPSTSHLGVSVVLRPKRRSIAIAGDRLLTRMDGFGDTPSVAADLNASFAGKTLSIGRRRSRNFSCALQTHREVQQRKLDWLHIPGVPLSY